MSAFTVLAQRCEELSVAPLVGVYFLLDGDEIVYIGSSSNVTQRITNHINEGYKHFDRALFLPVDESSRLKYEGALIRAFAPTACATAPIDRGDADVYATLGIAPSVEDLAKWKQLDKEHREWFSQQVRESLARDPGRMTRGKRARKRAA